MPTAHEFQNKKELVKQLGTHRKYLTQWFDRRHEDVWQMVIESVGSGTFRAFRGRPSEVYRSWAYKRLQDTKVVEQIGSLNSEEEYDWWIENFSTNFRKYWSNQMGAEKRISYGPSRKLPNLLMKHIVLWNRFDDEQRSRLIRFLHIPFDSYSLLAIRNCIPAPHGEIVGRIPKNVTMKFVDSQAKYDALQTVFRMIANEAKVPAIYVDVLAWNKSHGYY
jgi:hypothetical protein